MRTADLCKTIFTKISNFYKGKLVQEFYITHDFTLYTAQNITTYVCHLSKFYSSKTFISSIKQDNIMRQLSNHYSSNRVHKPAQTGSSFSKVIKRE
jgi:hypothetical protein